MPRDNGLARLKRRLDRMPADVKAALAPALEKSAQELADTMKHLAGPVAKIFRRGLRRHCALLGPRQSNRKWRTGLQNLRAYN